MRLAPFDSKVDEYFSAHAALQTRLAFERQFGALPATVRGVEPSPRQLLDTFGVAGGPALVSQLLAAYRTATVAISDSPPDGSLQAILSAARSVFAEVRKEAGGREAGRELLAMLSLFAALRARREAKARFHDNKTTSATEPTSTDLSGFLRSLGQASDVELLRSEVRDVRAAQPPETPTWEVVLCGWARLREPRLVGLATAARQGSDTWTLTAYQQAYRQIPELASLCARAIQTRGRVTPMPMPLRAQRGARSVCRCSCALLAV